MFHLKKEHWDSNQPKSSDGGILAVFARIVIFWFSNPNSQYITTVMMLDLGPIPFFTQRTSRAHAQTTHPKDILYYN